MSEFYLKSHEWARLDGDTVVIGLSPFAAGEVGEIIHVELPKLGTTVNRGKPCAEIESVKSVNDYYSPVDGTVIAINTALGNAPETVNQDPLASGWFARIRPAAADPLDGLMNKNAYEAQIRA